MTSTELAARPRRPLRGRRSAESGRRWPLSRWFAVGGSVATVIVLAAVTAAGVALWRLDETSAALVDGTSPALLTAQQLSAALVDQETGVRGYDLTGRPDFLDPYRSGLDAERAAVARLRGFSADLRPDGIDPGLDAVEQSAQRWRSEYAQPVVDNVPGAPTPEEGRTLFNQVRAATDALLDDLREQRAATRARMDAATAFLVGTVTVVVVVLVLLLVTVGVVLRRGVLRPVSDLAAQVRDVVSGGVQREVVPGGPQEIMGLGEDVEAMRRHILRDLDDAQAVNRQLDEQARDLERSNRDLEQFAYVASHDLQEPLRKVSSFCQLLQRRYEGRLDERADQYIAFAVDGASRMQRLINDLLAFSRVGRSTSGFEPLDLGEIAASAAAQLEPARKEAGGELVIDALPTVAGDRALLHALLVNLMGNALKFHRDGVPPVVRVQARRDGDSWEVTVTDNGIGIEAEYGEKVFVIFQRLHGHDVYPGTGIGLALAKKIVEFHGGEIGLVESPDPGAVIRFTLPVPPEEARP